MVFRGVRQLKEERKKLPELLFLKLGSSMAEVVERRGDFQAEQYRPPPPQHASILVPALLFPTMIALLQLKYQGSDKSPFDTHSAQMFLSVASFLIYCFSLNALLKISPHSNYYYAKMVQFSASVFGPLTLASFLSLLFPLLCPILYTFSVLYSAADQLLYSTLLIQRFKRFYQKFTKSTDAETASENQIPV
ncbi:hypothetical protein HAX54_025428 [Datura stramonium]|uniref:Uncharacterized protein n=1 Tax=Datura stramonium TaxID=4076 RepID=A0ABS8V1J1_DATST|nr:hypothetical protein [Datura stramonium]